MNRPRQISAAALISCAALLYPVALRAQVARTGGTVDLRAIHPSDRIAGGIDDQMTVAKPGNRHPLARAEFDLGAAPADHRMDRMVLVLENDPVQERALEEFLAEQQDPQSQHYHQWLTPEEFGDRFGVSDHDLAQIVAWLEREGFEVEPVPAGRRSLVFSGTAAQVSHAFHTQIHMYDIKGERHYANATDPSVPAALASVVQGIATLHDFRARPMHLGMQPLAAPSPEYSSGSTHYMAPADFATIYDAASLYSSSIDGSGQSIAIAGRTNFKTSDVTAFRSTFGLPANSPTIILNGTNPGIVSP